MNDRDYGNHQYSRQRALADSLAAAIKKVRADFADCDLAQALFDAIRQISDGDGRPIDLLSELFRDYLDDKRSEQEAAERQARVDWIGRRVRFLVQSLPGGIVAKDQLWRALGEHTTEDRAAAGAVMSELGWKSHSNTYRRGAEKTQFVYNGIGFVAQDPL